jgi:hypothetical protein
MVTIRLDCGALARDAAEWRHRAIVAANVSLLPLSCMNALNGSRLARRAEQEAGSGLNANASTRVIAKTSR